MGITALKLIIIGYFKKVVIADSISPFVDSLFSSPTAYGSGVLILGAFLYAFQIYADFSGYSDIARGVAGLFGIDLMVNFEYPFFSKNVGEFWRRWHISLSTWLNDYVFKPVAIEMRNWGNHGIYIAIMTTFLVSGLWHGEGYTYLTWGLLHAIYYLPLVYGGDVFTGITTGQQKFGQLKLRDIPAVMLNFFLVVFALLFFRSPSLGSAITYLSGITNFHKTGGKSLLSSNTEIIQFTKSLLGIIVLVCLDLWCYHGKKLNNFIYYFLLLLIVFMGSYSNSISFIYFKF
jgi:D-alanyl-lipoteichoic acid acyltransferase DltB (MBOAT superfamily)